MTPDVSVIVVNHKSAAEALLCVDSLRAEFQSERVAGEIVLVDCDSGDPEQGRLHAIKPDVFVPLPENRGYSGGCNAGLARARAHKIIFSNADVVYGRGSLPTLLRALDDGSVGAAAPLAFWDAAGRIRMPPGYAPGFWRDLLQLSAGRWPAVDRRRFASFAREALRLWEKGGDTQHLTGAVLAVRREVLDRVGRFDESFPFEFEETEWEDRVRDRGWKLRFVPEARVRHLYARSAGRNPEAAARRAAGARIYRRRRYGRLGAAVLERAGRLSRPVAANALEHPRLPADKQRGAAVAISPNPSLLPFASASLSEDFELPADVIASLPAGPVYLRSFHVADGEPLETFVWSKP
jgi:GT2 family glycosyltransferase